ncbi:MAG: GLUG motif-containing protein, partial [Phocaeicola sp.]
MKTKGRTFRLLVTAICLFCINLVALAEESLTDWEQYGKEASFTSDVEIFTDGSYTIKTDKGLAWVAYVTNQGLTSKTEGDNLPSQVGFQGYTVKLANDITLSSSSAYTPIGTSDKPFLGTFDGNFKVVSGLTVTNAESAGLFGYVGKYETEDNKIQGAISNIGINGASVTCSKYAGALVGHLYGTMERCWSSGSVTAASSGTQTAEAAGGLVGEATDGSTISYCYSTASVTAPLAGGVVGSLNGTFSYCYATGKVTS